MLNVTQCFLASFTFSLDIFRFSFRVCFSLEVGVLYHCVVSNGGLVLTFFRGSYCGSFFIALFTFSSKLSLKCSIIKFQVMSIVISRVYMLWVDVFILMTFPFGLLFAVLLELLF